MQPEDRTSRGVGDLHADGDGSAICREGELCLRQRAAGHAVPTGETESGRVLFSWENEYLVFVRGGWSPLAAVF
jgi:hypothetical protein